MTIFDRTPLFLILIYHSINLLTLAQNETHFIYEGFHSSNLQLDGLANIHPNGLLQLTNTSFQKSGHAFYTFPVKFNTSSLSGLVHPQSFSTNFIVAMVPESTNRLSGHGLAFVISPSMNFTHALPIQYLGLFNATNNGLSSNHVFAIEFDTSKSLEFDDIDANHVGLDVNGLKSNFSVPAAYFSEAEGKNNSFSLISGNPMQVWIDYDGFAKLMNVTLAPTNIPKPRQPLISTTIDLSLVFLDTMYVGFSSSTGVISCNHYVLGWSFNTSGKAQELKLSKLPSYPPQRKPAGNKTIVYVSISLLAVSAVMLIIISGIAYILSRKKYEEIYEDWEQEYGPHRFSFKDLYKATGGFKENEVLGVGGFGKVYRGVLPRSNVQVAIKKVSHNSTQGIKEFVAEVVCMGRLRHRNLVQLLGYCRRRGELLLVYDYMPNGSLDKILLSENPNLNWAQRYHILKGIASGLLYLHEEWEQVVLHRDVKASNVLLDADKNGRLGDFGLARLYDHGANPQTTRVVGTVGYIAPELTKTGKATTSTDVFAFGAFMLEVACGRRPLEVLRMSEEMVLVDWVLKCMKRGNNLQTIDPRLEGEYVKEEAELVLKLGLLCSHSNPEVRPSMREVMQYFDGQSVLPEIALDIEGGSTAFVDGGTEELVMTFPSSFGNDSVCYASSSSSILSRGR